MKLRIITPEQIILERDVEAVYAYGPEGRFGILPRHIPMISILTIGVLCYFIDGRRHCASIIGGILKTDGKEVVVLSDAAELGEAIDVLRAEHAKRRAEERLRSEQKDIDIHRAELALTRAITRIKASHGLFNS